MASDAAESADVEPGRFLATEVEVSSAFLRLEAGRWPLLRFTFRHEESVCHVDLVLDVTTTRSFRRLVASTVDAAITSARRGR